MLYDDDNNRVISDDIIHSTGIDIIYSMKSRALTLEELMLIHEISKEKMYCEKDGDRVIKVANTQDKEVISFVSRVINGKGNVLIETVNICER